MKQIKILSHSLDFALSNKYLEFVIQYLEPKLFNKIVEVLFYKIKHWIFLLICYLLSLSEGNNLASANSMQHCSKHEQNESFLSTLTGDLNGKCDYTEVFVDS